MWWLEQARDPRHRLTDASPRAIEVRREEALLKTGALQDAIFNSANFSSIATDEKGVIQIFNVGAERMLGYTAVEVLNFTPADISDPQEVIALDIMMPTMDGPATLAVLRSQPATASVPVNFLTAKAFGAEVERMTALGAAGVLIKPFDPRTLSDDVRAPPQDELVASSPKNRRTSYELSLSRNPCASWCPIPFCL